MAVSYKKLWKLLIDKDIKKKDLNRKRIHCPNCGTEWYVDGDDQYINE